MMFKDGMNCITRRKNARKRKMRIERENKTIRTTINQFYYFFEYIHKYA